MTENLQNSTPTTSDSRRIVEPITVLDKVGMGILSLLALTGLWMMVAPFLVGYQSRGANWTAGTTNDFVVGLALAALSLGGLFAVLSGSLAAIARSARDRTPDAEG